MVHMETKDKILNGDLLFKVFDYFLSMGLFEESVHL